MGLILIIRCSYNEKNLTFLELVPAWRLITNETPFFSWRKECFSHSDHIFSYFSYFLIFQTGYNVDDMWPEEQITDVLLSLSKEQDNQR